MSLRRGSVLAAACGALLFLALPIATAGAAEPEAVDAAKGAGSETAFNSAKELGTADAWNAFLSNYPNGFYADLARAYLKKLTDQSAPASPAASASAGKAQEISCSESGKLRSQKSDVAALVTFVNNSSMYRSIQWIDFEGGFKDHGGLNPGERLTVETFVSHPWMVATGPGDCLQIFLPDAGLSTIELGPAGRRRPEEHARGKAAAEKGNRGLRQELQAA